jgi:hypothetical protein
MTRGGMVLAGLLAAFVGCRPCEVAPPVRANSPPLPLTDRGSIEPDVSDLPTQPAKAPPARPERYRRLTVAECRTFAIANAPLAADLTAHPGNDSPLHRPAHRASDRSSESRTVRGFAADAIRNRAAAEALEEYYKLAAAEGQFDLSVKAHGILRTHRDAAQKAIEQGLKDRGDINTIRRQLFEVESQAAKLEAGIGALNASLAGRLGLDPGDTTPIWPADALRVSDSVMDPESAFATALHYRPDLNLLRALVRDDGGDAQLANSVLQGINPLLGTQPAAHPLAFLLSLAKHDGDDAKLQRQLIGVLETRERQAEAEVRAAVATLRGERTAVIAKAAEVRNLVARVDELTKREAAGQQVTVELVTSRLDLLKARSELLQSVADWHVADVKLRQAMGLLVRE